MAFVIGVVFLFFNFCVVNLKAKNAIIDCSTGVSNHTLCLNFQNYSLEFCEDYKDDALLPEDKDFIVDFHNNLRAKIVKGTLKQLPKGYYIKKLSWNQDLANLAQKWAEQCQTGNLSDIRLFHNELLGRNVAIVDAQDPSMVDLERLIDVWSSGLDNLTPEIIKSYMKPTSRANDFEPAAQMIWWNTSQIGCSRSIYKPVKCTTDNGKKICARNRAVVQLVCTYFPVGNRIGEPVYNTNENKKYICQYDSNKILCTDIRFKGDATRRRNTYRDSMIDRMRDDFDAHWPVLMGCAKSWNLDFFFYTYFLFFFIYSIY